MPIHTLVNGNYSDSVSVDDRGLAYGDGLFETIKVTSGKPEWLELHLQRLLEGCCRLQIPLDLILIRQDIRRLLDEYDISQAIIKIIISRGGSERGYKSDLQKGSNRLVSLQAWQQNYSRQQTQGVITRLCDTRLAINPALAGIKHLCRLENVLARSEWQTAVIDEGLMLDSDSRLVEGTMSNLFLVSEQRLITPSLHRCGVAGVIRQQIIEKLSVALNLHCVITDVTIDDAYRAEEIFVCNSLMGIWPVIAIGCHRKPVGDITVRLQQALMAGN
jgi:4-amino-4-deoxychorismate lyase